VSPRYKSHPPKIRGWATRVSGVGVGQEFFDVHEFIGKKLSAEIRPKIEAEQWGLIAGNGRFPFLVLEGARSQGLEMAVIALKEEASEELGKFTSRIHWVSLGELSKAIDLMHQEGVTRAVMA
jgi:hypothetical protein